MKLEVDPRSVDGDKYRVATAVAEIVRPFVLNGSLEFIPTNITVKEVARVAERMDPHKVTGIIDEKQQLTASQSAHGSIVFSDPDGNIWNVSQAGSKSHTRIKRAAKMAGHRGVDEGGLAAKRTFRNMARRFEFESMRINLRGGLPTSGLRVEIARPTSQRWTNAAKTKTHEAEGVSWEILRKSGHYSRDPIQLEAEHRALAGF